MIVYKYPDKILRERSIEIDIEEIPMHLDLIENMKQTMYDAEGVGLAAPQVGINKRIIIIDPSPIDENSQGFLALINPAIIHFSKATDTFEEGCLSVPGIIAPVVRSVEIFLNACDINGNKIERAISGFTARLIQHEIDHLNGVLFIDRLNFVEKIKIKSCIKEIENEFSSR